jgi:predicted DNA-binding transcriptional regulator AlpA
VVTKEEQWQWDVVVGLNRLLEVLHDISDTVHATHVLMQEQNKQVTRALPTVNDDGDRLLNVEETCEFLGVSRSQIYGTFRYMGPKAIKIGKRTMYRKADLVAWLDSKRDLRIENIASQATRVHDPMRPYTGYKPASERPTCKGSGTEPVRTNKHGYGVCRECGSEWVHKKKNGTLFKHKVSWF